MDELHRRIAANIRRVARAKKILLTHLPDRAGVARGHFFAVIAGEGNPTIAWLAKIASALDVDVSDLVRPRR